MWYLADADDQRERVAKPAPETAFRAKDATWPPPDGLPPNYYEPPPRKPPQRETAADVPGTEYWLP